MEKHTRGLKDTRIFYKDEANQPYELITRVDNQFVMRNLITGEDIIYNPFTNTDNDVVLESPDIFVEITQAEVFDCIDNEDDEQHAKMMDALGIGYICPFCGGRLHWESDFMAPEVHGMYNTYIEVTNEDSLANIKEHESEYMSSHLLGVTDNIEKEKEKVEQEGWYEYTYLREDKDGVSTYYEIDDSVIGIYRCSSCGKHYEIQDCLPSEEDEYPYFNDSE